MVDHTILHNDEKEFLRRKDRNTLRLTGSAAIAACEQAANHNLSIGRIEGGLWLNPGFEERLDSIWTRAKASSIDEIARNNLNGADFIRSEIRRIPEGLSEPANAFILTASPIGED